MYHPYKKGYSTLPGLRKIGYGDVWERDQGESEGIMDEKSSILLSRDHYWESGSLYQPKSIPTSRLQNDRRTFSRPYNRRRRLFSKTVSIALLAAAAALVASSDMNLP